MLWLTIIICVLVLILVLHCNYLKCVLVPSNKSEDLSCNNQDAGLLRPAQLPLSNVNDIPMTLSYPFKTIHISANHHKYLNLDLYQYDFKTELSILNDKLS